MNTFHLRILSAEEPMYDGPCESLQFPCSDGQYGIQAKHTPMLAAMIPGLLSYRTPGQEMRGLSVSTGMVKVDSEGVLVLADAAEWPEEIDEDRARRDVEEAERKLREQRSRNAYLAANAELARALSRLHLKQNAEKYIHPDK